MDPSRFDALTRLLAARPSRRQLLRSLSGGLTAGLLGREALAADCKADGKACAKGSQCCSGLCAPPPTGHTSVAHSTSVCCTPHCTGRCGGAGDGCGGTCDTACPPAPFDAPCTTNAGCASGVCACILPNCSTGGLCATPYHSGCPGAAPVATPSGGVEVCGRDGDGFCGSAPCPSGQVCGPSNACFVLVNA
jgi:hypothetical protein